MVKGWAATVLALIGLSSVGAQCDDINTYLNIPNPMTGDMTINLDEAGTIQCPEYDPDDGPDMEIVTVNGGTLTLESSSTVRLINFGFMVVSGSHLVFDMPKTRFGPNSEGFHRASYSDSFVEIEEGASATFNGKVVAKDVANVYSIFHNQGTLEIKKSALFQDGSNVFRINTGVVKFRGTATFKDNKYLAVNNEESGYMRFSKDVIFENNAFQFDGASGCSVAQKDPGTKIVFRGDVTVMNNDCDEGVAVYNDGDMKFYGKTIFSNNFHRNNGGAVYNVNGNIDFKAAAQFLNNESADFGGGIASTGGTIRFEKAVLFEGNKADSGAAFAIEDDARLEFMKPDVVRIRDNIVTDIDTDSNCSIGEVEEPAMLVGFPGDDVCAAVSS